MKLDCDYSTASVMLAFCCLNCALSYVTLVDNEPRVLLVASLTFALFFLIVKVAVKMFDYDD